MSRALSIFLALGLSACSSAGDAPPPPPAIRPRSPDPLLATSQRSEAVADARLEIQLEIRPGITMGRIPRRVALLRFRNVGAEPVRVYLPNAESFRADVSSLSFVPSAGQAVVVPGPQPGRYDVTEADFHLLAPGASRSFLQEFVIDTARSGAPGSIPLPGFEPGRQVRVRWRYENRVRRWEAGRQTPDGVTKGLFGGADIPHIWTGDLSTDLSWTVP